MCARTCVCACVSVCKTAAHESRDSFARQTERGTFFSETENLVFFRFPGCGNRHEYDQRPCLRTNAGETAQCSQCV